MRFVDASASEPAEVTSRRPYRSPLREQRTAQTRRAVVEAARERFMSNGWAATGMREVAAAAGVAVETVYSHFSSKPGVLRAVADAAVVGDDAPIALADRPEFLSMGEGRRSARVAAAAKLVTGVQMRTAAIAELLRQAAPDDQEIAEMLDTARELQRRDVATALELIIGRVPTPPERDGVWAVVSPEVYLLLIRESGWTPEQYEGWIAATLDAVIPCS